MRKRLSFLLICVLAIVQSGYAQYRTRYNELSIRWAKTFFMERPLFHPIDGLPLGIHYTRHFENGQGFQVEIGGEYQDVERNYQVYINKGQNTTVPWLRGFADGSFKWMYPLVRKKPFRLHVIGGLTYRKLAEAYGTTGGDLLIPIYSDFIGPQLGLKATYNPGRFFVLGLSQEAGAFYLIEGGIPQGKGNGVYVTSQINFTTRLSLGFCF